MAPQIKCRTWLARRFAQNFRPGKKREKKINQIDHCYSHHRHHDFGTICAGRHLARRRRRASQSKSNPRELLLEKAESYVRGRRQGATAAMLSIRTAAATMVVAFSNDDYTGA
jgi:hypothetical protein